MNFDINALFLPLLQILLVSLRVGALWMFFPILGNATLPPMVRLAGALTLSMALRPLALPHLPPWTIEHMPALTELVMFVLRELIIGIGMGLIARWMFSVAASAAQWVGTQMGFSMGGIFNPEMQGGESAWADLHQWIATMVFLGIGGHWLLIQAVADSYTVDLTGALARLGDTHAAGAFWIETGSRFFVWMLKLSGPMVAVLLLLQVAMGVLSRFVPQINVWMVSIPLTIAVGVFVFTLLSPMYGDALTSLFGATNESTYMWIRFLGVR